MEIDRQLTLRGLAHLFGRGTNLVRSRIRDPAPNRTTSEVQLATRLGWGASALTKRGYVRRQGTTARKTALALNDVLLKYYRRNIYNLFNNIYSSSVNAISSPKHSRLGLTWRSLW